jgi:signal transduction histidine kinase
MTIHNSLFAKILAWFMLNLALIGLAVWGFIAFNIKPASPEQRVRQVAREISYQLSRTDQSRADWAGVLQRYSENYRVTFDLRDNNGSSITGQSLELPEAVRSKLPRPRTGPNRRRAADNMVRFIKNQYSNLNATAEQVVAISAAWRDSFRERSNLSLEIRQKNLPRQERIYEWNRRNGEITKKLQDRIRSQLNEEQKPAYEKMLTDIRNRQPGLPRTLFPRLNDQQLDRYFKEADQDQDGALTRDEMRRFILETALPERPNERPGPGRPPPGVIRSPLTSKDRAGPPQPPVFMIKTDKPVRFWAGVDIPVIIKDHNATTPAVESLTEARGLREVPRGRETHYLATLLMVSDTRTGHGLFGDPIPWITIILVAVVLSALFWLPMVRNITRPIAEVTAATEQIAQGKFDTRVGTGRSDEIGRVGQAVDHMADRLDGFVRGQKRFLGDISHELCSPIARIQAALANLEQRADESHKKYVDGLREEVEHMSELVDELLMFSRAGMKTGDVKLESVPLAEMIQRVVDREGAAAVKLNLDVPHDLKVKADPTLLARALGNLLRNAVRYAGQAGTIELSASREVSRVKIIIGDQGPGIPVDDLPRIFDPFSRPEQDRSRDTGGAGLGLSIVKSCVEGCGGTVTCRNRDPKGLEFSVILEGA